MATYTIQVTHNGNPVPNVDMVIGTILEAVTDAQGKVSRTTTAYTTRLAVPIFLSRAGEIRGGGPYLLVPGETLIIEV